MVRLKVHDDFHTACAEHCGFTYGERGEYAVYEPHYQFGQECALEDEFQGLPYEEASEQLRALHERRYPDVDYDDVAEAVRYAYERTGDAVP